MPGRDRHGRVGSADTSRSQPSANRNGTLGKPPKLPQAVFWHFTLLDLKVRNEMKQEKRGKRSKKELPPRENPLSISPGQTYRRKYHRSNVSQTSWLT